MAIVHQPSSDIFDLFDKAYILASGHEVYQGETKKICEYFAMIGKPIPPYTNPADRIIVMMHAKENPEPEDIARQQELFDNYNKHLRPAIENSMPGLAEAAPPIDPKLLGQFRSAGFMLEFNQLLSRGFRNFIRNNISTWVNLGQAVIISIIIDILFWNKSGQSQQMVRERSNALLAAVVYIFLHSINSVLLTCKYQF